MSRRLRSPIVAASSTISASSASAPPRADCAWPSRRWPGRRHVRDHRDAWEIVRQVDHPAVGLALDAFSSLAPGIPIDSLKAIRREKLFHVQIADAPKLAMDPLSWSRHFRCMPGQGDLPLVEYVSALQAASAMTACCRSRYSTIVSAPDRPPTSRSTACARSTTCASRWSGKPDSRTVCKGIEFIEFCASEEEAEQLGQMLRMLGFVATHRHVRKTVTRWRQGDINLVVNCEPDGFAHSFDTVHGASVCAIGLRVAGSGSGAAPREPAAGPELFAARGARRVRDPGAARRRRQPALLHEGVRNPFDLEDRVRGAAARIPRASTRVSSASIISRRACSTRRCSPGCCTT